MPGTHFVTLPLTEGEFMQKSSVELATAHATTTEQKREDQIRTRAYELYEQRGREDGHDQEDWLRAEAEIIEKAMRTAA